MKCELCKKEINNFNPKLNQLQLEENIVNICSNCTDKILEWQQNIFKELFPRKSNKKISQK